MSIYEPWRAQILKVSDLTYDAKLFRIKVPRSFDYEPGQFVELSIPGIGEAPISISSTPLEKGYIDLGIRRVGAVTNAIHAKKAGEAVYIRGPYGTGYPFEAIKGKDILFVSGGTSLATIRSSINYVLAHKKEFGKVTIMYGARTPADLWFREEFDSWKKQSNFLVTVDSPRNPDGNECGWNECVGVVTTLFDKVDFPLKDHIAVICGPPIMYTFVIKKLKELGVSDRQIYISLERLMKCGVGKCQHCQVNHKYACIDGPVFNYADTGELPEAI